MKNAVFALIGATALVGCTVVEDDQNAPGFPAGAGQEAQATLAYPDGPFGVHKGSVIANFAFYGYANASAALTLTRIELAEFYNPTGDGLFEEGSVFPVGTPKPRALAITVGSVWCGPCNYEADMVLPDLYAQYAPLGGEIFSQLADGPTVGKPATEANLHAWGTKYDVQYPLVIDPGWESRLGALFAENAFPTNIIIDPRTMTIVEAIAGAPEPGGAYWQQYEDVLAL